MFLFVAVVSAFKYEAHMEKSFLAFMRSHHIYFSGEEYHLRFGIFLQTMRYIQDRSPSLDFSIGLTKFACYTPSEYQWLHGYTETEGKYGYTPERVIGDVPEAYDWVSNGNVNPIKDQQNCVASWAFAAVSAMESQWSIRTATTHKNLYDLSESALIDCCFLNQGCEASGTAEIAFDYVVLWRQGSFMRTSDYPYTPAKGTCKWDYDKQLCNLVRYRMFEDGNEVALKGYIYDYGPGVTKLDTTPFSFQLYTGGVYKDPLCVADHRNAYMVIVGYGADKDVKYWLIRNSWGAGWGEKGYMRLFRDEVGKANICGVATRVLIPEVKVPPPTS
jgi:cathepsin L